MKDFTNLMSHMESITIFNEDLEEFWYKTLNSFLGEDYYVTYWTCGKDVDMFDLLMKLYNVDDKDAIWVTGIRCALRDRGYLSVHYCGAWKDYRVHAVCKYTGKRYTFEYNESELIELIKK